MECPKCGRTMTIGAPHSEGDKYQYECLGCGHVIPVGRTEEDIYG